MLQRETDRLCTKHTQSAPSHAKNLLDHKKKPTSLSRGRTATTDAAATAEATTVTGWGTSTPRAANWTLSTLLPGLHRDASSLPITGVDPDATLTTSHVRQGRNNSTLSGIKGSELEEGAGLRPDDFKLLDGTEACSEGVRQGSIANGLHNTLRANEYPRFPQWNCDVTFTKHCGVVRAIAAWYAGC
jgi:hypothetical protein